MANLVDTYRPKTWTDFIGQPKAIIRLRAISEEPGFDRGAFLLTGPSGSGKTSAAFVLASALGVIDFHMTTIHARKCTLDSLKDVEREMWYAPFKGWGKLYLIDECDTMSSASRDYLLGLFERLPPARVIVCTSNKPDGGFSETLFSRVFSVFFVKPHSMHVEAHLRSVAAAIGFEPGSNGFNWRRFVSDRHNNIRKCLADLQTEAAVSRMEARVRWATDPAGRVESEVQS